MYLDVQVRLPNNFWARHLVDTVAMWLKCNSTIPFRWMVGYPEYSRLRNGIRYREVRLWGVIAVAPGRRDTRK
jgi:hypothetical protein